MATTIGELDYKIILDDAQFEKAARLTAKETREMNKTIRETQTPLERYERELDKLNNLRRKGAITAQQYARAIEKEKKAYANATKSAKNYGDTLKNLAAGVAAVSTAQRAFSKFRQEMLAIDETAKQARFLGVMTEDFVALQHAAEQTAGITGQAFSTALQRMTRRISEAAKGTGEAKDALKELELSAKRLNDLSADEQFREIAMAMRTVGSESDRVRLAMKLFDTEGARLALTLKDGAAALDEYAREAKDLGLTFTDEQAREIEATNDAIDEFNKSIDGLFRALAIHLNPELQQLVNLMNQVNGVARESESTFGQIKGIAGQTGMGHLRGGYFGAIYQGGRAAMNRVFPGGAAGADLETQDITKMAEGMKETAEEAKKQLTFEERMKKLSAKIKQDRIEAERRNKAVVEQNRRWQIEQWRKREELAKQEIEAIKEQIKLNKENEKILSSTLPEVANSFGAGSRGEYEFLRDRQRRRLRDQQQRAAEQKAEQQREQANAKLEAANNALQAIRERIQGIQRI